MMTILMTSFDAWKPEQTSNSSDDLVAEMAARGWLDASIQVLRKVPVDFQLAPEKIIAEIARCQPKVVVCCGMAERRSHLTVESNGQQGDDVLLTTIAIAELIHNLPFTQISHDAGQFVCNHTYYSVLNHIRQHQLTTQAIFVHVPVFQESNRDAIIADFAELIKRLQRSG